MNSVRPPRQQVAYQIQASGNSAFSPFNPLDFRVVHTCEHHKIILTVNHFDEVCKEKGSGKGCRYCHGYMLSEYGELRARGYKPDFYDKYICDTRGIAHRLV